MGLHTYVLVKEAYDAWKKGDLEAFGALMAEDVGFAVPFSTHTYVGSGSGREELKRRLQAFLDDYEVLMFHIVGAVPSGTECVFRIQYRYRARDTGLDIEGSQRHAWRVKDNEIVAFTVMHDAQRLGAFFGLSGHALPPAASPGP